ALGSMLAMYHFLIQKDHDVNMVVPTPYPDFLTWMPCQEKILIYKENKKKYDPLFDSAEILFSLDYNAPGRLEITTQAFKKAN
ncbi:MAG: bifunctional oligoribonuclease/PAP phosphatase NrnA, partial [Bacteroidales bacterium]|nr:bifunctional oligoribonuclease/PAP phosphatase NrnA [Bacteroidales bacterium]